MNLSSLWISFLYMENISILCTISPMHVKYIHEFCSLLYQNVYYFANLLYLLGLT
jgi:hypothetical protein